MTVISDLLYIGTRGGALLAFNSSSMQLHFTSYVYDGPVRCLLKLPKQQTREITQPFSRNALNLSYTGSCDIDSDQLEHHQNATPYSSLDRSKSPTTSLYSQPSSSENSVLVSIGLRYRGVVGESENCPPTFILPSDGKQTLTKPLRPNPQDNYMLLWSTKHHGTKTECMDALCSPT